MKRPTILRAPKLGNLSTIQIQRAVDAVSKPKKDKLVVSLSDKENVKALLKHIYHNDEVKDDYKDTDTLGSSGTKSSSPMAELPPNCT